MTSIALAALALAGFAASASAANEFEKYALESVATALTTTQAGAHPDFTTAFTLTHKGEGDNAEPFAFTRDIEVHLPPGMIGNPQQVPRCTVAQLGNLPEESECPIDSQVGVTETTLGGVIQGSFTEPVYNMVAPPESSDVVARLGFFAAGWPAFINVRLDPADYSLVASVEGLSAGAGLVAANTTLWGVPAAHSHDGERMTPDEARQKLTPPIREATVPEAPFLSNPTDCSLTRQVTITARSYQLPEQPSTISAPFPQITGCGKLAFEPSFTAIPTSAEASAPTGLDTDLQVSQNETPQGLATSTLKAAVVTLPPGMAINPSAAEGLAACSAEEVGFGKNEPSHCPDAAKIGSAEMDVPALEKPLHGAVYQRTPEPGHLFRFWLVTDEQGVHLKLPAEIEANPLTGQLTTLFNGIPSLGGNPQVPFAGLKLHIFGGSRAPLSTPAHCGTYDTAYSFAPWSDKAPIAGETPMQITSGCGKGGFAPGLIAGTDQPSAGSFSPFVFTLTRQDGEANPKTISLHLPQGLLAKLGGIPLCPDQDAATGNCPAASQIGTITAAAGVGGAPLWIPQPGKEPTAVYLAGPYKGAPYSIIAKVPAQAGPFDLGTVVNRSQINVDPTTVLATITTDPLPQILEGVPVLYRAIHVDVTRPEFTLNPTSCEAKQIKATVVASNGATAEPSDGFQATNCAKLPYSPQLKLFFKGKTRRSADPAVKAVLTQPANQANTTAATVILPSSEFIDQSHVNNPCTRVQFNAGACPPSSILGTAKAITPLLEAPLEGPIYFRSNGGEGGRKLPDIVADLHGRIHITLVGFIDSVKKKGTEIARVRVRFQSVPDAPVTRFETSFYGGKRSLIENHANLCEGKHRAQVIFTGQNGRVLKSRPVIGVSCKKRG
ncbi:MAG: hypothetical protein ACTHNP_10155 [Solirubrobacterales bacterium]